ALALFAFTALSLSLPFRACGRLRSHRRHLHGRGLQGTLLLAGTTPTGSAAGRLLAGSKAMAGRPCRGHGRGQPPLQRAWLWPSTLFPRSLCCENVAITRRTILRDLISSHVI
ncbi:hypothetical protein BHM03_00021136, partial [Ensete ventricosum]